MSGVTTTSVQEILPTTSATEEQIIQAARDAGQRRMVLTSNHKLKDALRLYEDFGFQYVEYSDKWFQLSDVRMELEL